MSTQQAKPMPKQIENAINKEQLLETTHYMHDTAFRRIMISMTTSMISPMPGGMYQMFDKYLRSLQPPCTNEFKLHADLEHP